METPKSLFASRLVFFFTHVLAPFAAIGAFAHVCWLGWEGCKPELQHQILLSLGFLLAVPMAAVLRLALNRKPIGVLAQLLFLGAGFALFFGVQGVIREASRAVESWAMTPMDVYCFFLSATILVGAGLGRIATAEWSVSRGENAAIVAILGVGFPFLFFCMMRLGSSTVGVPSWVVTSIVVVCGVSLFIALFRVVFGLAKCLGDPRAVSRGADLGLTLLFALALPLGGLTLNLKMPFPADFANPWAWGLVVWTTLVLVPRVSDHQRFGRLVWFLQWTAFPFVLYFFILFIPFMPLAIIAVIFVGTGFLILAPTLLFRWTTAKLAAQYAALRARGVPKKTLVVLAILGSFVLPVGFAVDVEIERVGLQALLAWHTGEDFSKPEEPLPVSDYRARRIVANANDFAFGSEIPFLSAYRTWRVYGGLYLADQLREELNVRVAGRTSGRELDDGQADRNVFGSIFGGNMGRRNARVDWRWRVRPPKTTDCTVALGAVTNHEFEVQLKVRGLKFGDAEFIADLGFPAGAWVGGLELQMPDGSWKAGHLSERKAAEWVYRKITEQRRDPSILTTDGPGRGHLKVFPVPPSGRSVRFRLRIPDGAACDHIVCVNGMTYGENASAERLWTDATGRVTVVSAGWAAAHTNELVVLREPGEKLVFDGQDPDLYRKLRRAACERFRTLSADLAEGKGPVEFVITNTAPAKAKIQRRGRSRQKPSFVNLDDKKRTILRQEYPGQVAFGDRPVDGWYLMGTVPVPYRAGEGALVYASLDGAEKVSSDNADWQRGAEQWGLERTAFLNPQDDFRRAILAAARESGLVSDSVASIALESTMQEKGLKLAEFAALHGDKSLDFEEPATEGDTPGFLILLLGCLLIVFVKSLKRSPRSRPLHGNP